MITEEIVADHLSSGRYEWRSGYSIILDDSKLLVQVRIHLVPAPKVSPVQLGRVQQKWEKEIEHVWSNRFALVTDKGLYPIEVDVLFNKTPYHHVVIVMPGGGRGSDELNWHIMDSPQFAAHEFGHMLGVFDEYRGGAQNPGKKVINPASIMTSSPVAGKSFANHYKQFQHWFEKKTGLTDVTLEALSE